MKRKRTKHFLTCIVSGETLPEAGERGSGAGGSNPAAGKSRSVAGENHSAVEKNGSVTGESHSVVGENSSAALQRCFFPPALAYLPGNPSIIPIQENVMPALYHFIKNRLKRYLSHKEK